MGKKRTILAVISITISILFVSVIYAKDETPPAISITSPSDGAFVSDEVTISADAIDNEEVTNVDFYVDEDLEHTDDTAPYEYVWDASQLDPGDEYYIEVVVYDEAGNESWDDITVTIESEDAESPAVSITSPSDGASVFGQVTISVDASDNVEVTNVDFFVDESSDPVYTDCDAPYGYVWGTSQLEPGSEHSIEAVAYDEDGNESWDDVTVTVSPTVSIIPPGGLEVIPEKATIIGDATILAIIDKEPPHVVITNPKEGAHILGSVTIAVQAHDNDEVAWVYFLIDDVWKHSDGNPPYEYVWDASLLALGSEHTIYVIVRDRAGNVAHASVSVRIGLMMIEKEIKKGP